MPNSVYNSIISNRYRSFVDSFYSTRQWFGDELAKNHLYHAGEFGTSRENIVRNLLKQTVGSRFDVSHGFVLNPADSRTTQCDILVYDPHSTPLCDEPSGIRFFTAESVVAIGEVKSVLTKSKLKDALLLLADNKSIRDCFNGWVLNRPGRETFQTECVQNDAPFSFLFCESIDGFDPEINEWIHKQYDEASVPQYARHNLIISLENGALSYDASRLSELIPGIIGTWYYPILPLSGDPPQPKLVANTKQINNVAFFVNCLTAALNSATILPTDHVGYAG